MTAKGANSRWFCTGAGCQSDNDGSAMRCRAAWNRSEMPESFFRDRKTMQKPLKMRYFWPFSHKTYREIPVEEAKKGARKCYLASTPEVVQAFTTVIDTYTAGDPVQEGVRWTNLTRADIASALAAEGFDVSVTVVDRLLDESHMGQRKPQRVKTMRHHPDRNARFEWIAELKGTFLEAGLPVLSMDTKKREILGDYVRPGRVLSDAPLRRWDHDFPHAPPGGGHPAWTVRPGAERGILALGGKP